MRGGYYLYYGAGLGYQSTYGFTWSDQVYSNGNGYGLIFYNTGVNTLYADVRGAGFSIRCHER